MGIESRLAGGQPQHRYSHSPISCEVGMGGRHCQGGPQPAALEFSLNLPEILNCETLMLSRGLKWEVENHEIFTIFPLQNDPIFVPLKISL